MYLHCVFACVIYVTLCLFADCNAARMDEWQHVTSIEGERTSEEVPKCLSKDHEQNTY